MEHLWLYVVMSIVLILTPGVDTALVTRSTIAYGKKGGAATALGITTGVIVHTLFAAFGLSAILAQSAFLYEVVKYIGAAYLIYLGISSLWFARKKQTSSTGAEQQERTYHGSSCFNQGLLTNVLNPKVALFFLTFLPQFVQPGGNTLLQFTLLGVTYAVLAIIWLFVYIYLIDLIRGWLQRPSTQRALEGITGVALLLFGLKLAFDRR
ncbi:LysE family translocator [Brevibacillus humidisoli]|uniref:LysE family translocator n=1 Tax=Brevibacillus humidisoli TaxID=2895522 RepID=UPI001E388E4A|nr:LysE family translocator [Brevibacillus humidisoli]UFJ40747.1 LysE family translocator [Brevibacillus humidisoli]